MVLGEEALPMGRAAVEPPWEGLYLLLTEAS